MSKTRSISSLAAGLGILALACWFVTATFPLSAAPQTVADGPGVTVDTGGAVMHRTAILYPEAARAKRVQGAVTLEATVDGSGNVVETRVLGGPVELRRAAQQSVLNWHFATDTSMNTRMVKVNFELPVQSSTPAAAVPVPGAPVDPAKPRRGRSQNQGPPFANQRPGIPVASTGRRGAPAIPRPAQRVAGESEHL